ncbi:unnamed protein product [Bursaphelenchus xylophilus]|uniref:(pine wood nematode) hypothetical protein n=1 Tax=Bursaphelenchus xylophilus TaxID=6326 RepID=A0A7I8XDL5_BURXY|nr:unnamed protein product [Bursaphelenchus xylophilus]CAG9131652.1 unnamed protein product [Bursaphelenchus xylophilus]
MPVVMAAVHFHRGGRRPMVQRAWRGRGGVGGGGGRRRRGLTPTVRVRHLLRGDVGDLVLHRVRVRNQPEEMRRD